MKDKDLKVPREFELFYSGMSFHWSVRHNKESPMPTKAFEDEYVKVIDKSALEKLQAELDELNKNCISLGLHESRIQELREENERLKKLVEHFEEKIAEHSDAYAIDIFSDDKRIPCQTTAGRMGRHMCKVFLTYISNGKKEAGL